MQAQATFKDLQQTVERDEKTRGKNRYKKHLGFKFRAIDINKVKIRGSVPFATEAESQELLALAGVVVTDIKPKSALISQFISRFKPKKPSRIQYASLAEQLGDLLETGGMSIGAMLEMLARNNTNEILSLALAESAQQVVDGKYLHDAFAAQTDKKGVCVFPPTFVYALKLGTTIGALKHPETGATVFAPQLMLRTFAEGQKKAHEIVKKIRGAMMYPVFVFLAVAVAFVVEVYYVIPQFAQIFTALLTEKDSKLPALTQFMLDISDFFRSGVGITFFLLSLAALGGAIYYLYYHPQGIDLRERTLLRLPVVGGFYRDYHAAVVFRNLSMLYEGETDLRQRYLTAMTTTEHPNYREMLHHCYEQLFDHAVNFKDIWTAHFDLIGEEFRAVAETIGETGANQSRQLYSYAKILENRAEDKLEMAIALFSQMAILIPAAFVVFLLLASYLPLFELVGRMANK